MVNTGKPSELDLCKLMDDVTQAWVDYVASPPRELFTSEHYYQKWTLHQKIAWWEQIVSSQFRQCFPTDSIRDWQDAVQRIAATPRAEIAPLRAGLVEIGARVGVLAEMIRAQRSPHDLIDYLASMRFEIDKALERTSETKP